MKKILIFVFVVFQSVPVFAADLYLLHGVNGTDLGLLESLPVDIRVTGECVATNVPFRSFTPRRQYEAGAYEIIVTLAGGGAGPCQGQKVGQTRIDLSINESATVVAHLSAEGAFRLTKFTNDQQSTDGTRSRVTLRHAAAAPAVDVSYRIRFSGRTIRSLVNGAQHSSEVNAGDYTFRVSTTEGRRRALTTALATSADENLIVYLVGSAKRGTIAALTQRLPTP